MRTQVFYLLITAVAEMHGISLPFIQGIFLKTTSNRYTSTMTTLNGTCDECLCAAFGITASTNYSVLNCFGNGTCQLFERFPRSYGVQSSAGAQLYFLRGTLPSISRCCMPNITELVNRLKNATPVVISLSFLAGAIGYDENIPNRAVVAGHSPGSAHSFNPIDMTSIRNETVNTSNGIALHNGLVFTGVDGEPTVYALEQITLDRVANVTYPSLKQIRKFLFLASSQTIMVTTQVNQSVTMLDIHSPTEYTVKVRGTTMLSLNE